MTGLRRPCQRPNPIIGADLALSGRYTDSIGVPTELSGRSIPKALPHIKMLIEASVL